MQKNQQVDISLIFFSIAFCIVLLGLFSRLSFRKTSANTAAPAVNKPAATKTNRLDYNKPVLCAFMNTQASFSAQLRGTSVSFSMKEKTETTRVVVQGDCMYMWTLKEKTGQKQCGVGRMVILGKQLLGSGLASGDSLETLAKQIGTQLPGDIGKILESCRNGGTISEEAFLIPSGVKFQEQTTAK